MGGDDWIDDVADALKGLDIFDEKTRQALAEGVREALSSGADEPVVVSTPSEPVKGAPSLRVVQDDEAPEAAEESSVRVHVVPKVTARVRPPASLDVGHVVVDGEGWQTLWHGTSAAAYRLHCDGGELHASLDGTLAVQLRQGQSVDVEGRVIRVQSAGEHAVGRFVRL